jgi:regulatory protein
MAIHRSVIKRSAPSANDPAVALAKARSFCAYQERCKSEVVFKIHSFGLSEEQTEVIIKDLEEEDFLNEERFALAYARGKFSQLQWGRIKIKSELFSKGLPDSLIREAMDTIPDEEYLGCITSLVEAKRNSLSSIDDLHVLKHKIYSFLASKGFEEHLIYNEINKIQA